MITIVNYGGANLSSIQFSFQRLGVTTTLSSDPGVIKKSTHIILPGVASANRVMKYLVDTSLNKVICSLTQPILGICLGMQIMFDFSEEGNVDGLKIIPGKIQKILVSDGQSVPHMGWNQLNIIKNNMLLKNISAQSYVYFVHSFKAKVNKYTIASSCYGNEFAAVVQCQNFFGTQFHPERSGKVGAIILKNFLEL